MLNIRTKIIAIFVILTTHKTGFCQLTLESIFLTDKYTAVQPAGVQFLHTEPLFARYVSTENGSVIAFYNERNTKTNEWKIPVSPENKKHKWRNLILSNTDRYFLLNSDCEQLYRRSFLCSYFYGDEKGKLTALSDGKQLYPSFSPDDKKIAFIKNNNLFYKNILTGTETQITQDGEWNKVINGKSDWVYEEELKLTRAYEWNAPSSKIAYLKFDERNVKEYQIPQYYDLQYPNYFTYKYPKTGEENSEVSVWLYDVKSSKNKQIALPFSYEYIPGIYWNASGDELILLLLNRHQDSLQLVGYNTQTRKTRLLYLETDPAFIDIPETIKFLSDNSFIISSEKNGFNHLFYYDKDGNLLRQLTDGNFEVTWFYGVDEKNKTIYFQSNEGNPLETNVFSLNYKTAEKKRVTHRNGSNDAGFSNDFSFFINTYSSATTPPQITIEQTTADASVLIEGNKQIQDSLKTTLNKEFIKIPVKDYWLNGWVIKPEKENAVTKYPLLMFVYGGPGHQEVVNKWHTRNDLFFLYLAQQGYAVACVDNAGSGGSGSVFKKSVFLTLGKSETEDQIAAANYFGTLPFIDKNRIGIYGWSYGGFLAANCLFEGNDVFKAAIAAAPVSDWNLYNTIYTERYMRTPKENPIGYNSYNPNVLAKKLKGNLMLLHGTADENVHFQHTIHLINALNNANKSYQLYINPDAAHGASGMKMRYNLYTQMYLFLKEKL